MARKLLLFLMTFFFLMAPSSSFVKAADFDLSPHHGDYVLTENLTIPEGSVPALTEEELSQLSDQEWMEMMDTIMDAITADPQVAITRNIDEDSNVFFITIQDDYLVKRGLVVDLNVYTESFFQNENLIYNDRVAKFTHLASYMTHMTDDQKDRRHFFSFHEGDIYEIFLAEMIASRYEPLTSFRHVRNMTLEEVILPDDEQYSLLAYDMDKADFQEITYTEFTALEEYGPELITLSGEITAYNDTYMDYKEAEMIVEEDGQSHPVILRFFLLPLDPLEIGDKVVVYGKKSNNVNMLTDNYELLSMSVFWIEAQE